MRKLITGIIKNCSPCSVSTTIGFYNNATTPNITSTGTVFDIVIIIIIIIIIIITIIIITIISIIIIIIIFIESPISKKVQ